MVVIVALIGSILGGLLSRRWSGFLTILCGILAIVGGLRLIETFAALSEHPDQGSFSMGVAVGGFAVHAVMIVIAGLIPFLLRGLWRRWRKRGAKE